MGLIFAPNLGGRDVIYCCGKCDNYLTSHGELTSPHFNGSTGAAMLFIRCWNVILSSRLERRKMTTGWHVVRDVNCILCKCRLGWFYEMAEESNQVYKEGQYILENQLVSRHNTFDDPVGDDKKRKPPTVNLEQPHHFRRSHVPRISWYRPGSTGSAESTASNSSNDTSSLSFSSSN